ncbi:MAG: VWA domain-containing protein [Chitinispirillaceae bacterium]|nr:VWA domain-containing protein [Chitinispirillaceae bacterium]
MSIKPSVAAGILIPILLAFTLNGQSILFPVDSVKGPLCIVIDSVTKAALPLSPKSSTYNVVITDGLAQITLTQLFVNDFGIVKDIAYVFPLPHEAAVHAMTMEYRDSIYSAVIYEKQEAQQIYDSIVKIGGVAALLLQDRPNVFQQRIANIAFNDSAWIQIKLTMPLEYDNGLYELAIPTMVAERYQSENASAVLSSGRLWNPPPDRDGQTLQINVLLQTGFSISQLQSPTHPLVISEIDAVRPELEARSVIDKSADLDLPYNRGALLQQAATYPNRDFVLRFSRAEAELDFTLASTFDTSLNIGYFYSTIFPDTSLFTGDRSKLDVVILVDVSGSQSGWPLAKEKEIADAILDKLTPSDRFTVLSFNTAVSWCFGSSQSVEASGVNIANACEFISRLSATGGTNLLAGVQAALGIESGEGFSRFFVFLTDGFITNETAILDAITNHPTAPTVFTFGAGNNLNRYFLDEAAKVGNGVSTEITENEAVAPIVDAVWEKIESPQLQDISIAMSGLDETQLILPQGNMLYKGTPVTVFGVYREGGAHTVTIAGSRNDEPVTLIKEISLASTPTANSMVPQVWARWMIRKLRIEEGTGTSNRNHIIELSKQYQVLSDYTAFLAISPGEATEENRIGQYTAVETKAAAGDVLAEVSVKLLRNRLTVEIPAGASLREVAIYDLRGRCLFRISLRSSRCTRFVWDGRLESGRLISSGRYIVKVGTTRGQISRGVFWR